MGRGCTMQKIAIENVKRPGYGSPCRGCSREHEDKLECFSPCVRLRRWQIADDSMFTAKLRPACGVLDRLIESYGMSCVVCDSRKWLKWDGDVLWCGQCCTVYARREGKDRGQIGRLFARFDAGGWGSERIARLFRCDYRWVEKNI
jgi:hypothetical protein